MFISGVLSFTNVETQSAFTGFAACLRHTIRIVKKINNVMYDMYKCEHISSLQKHKLPTFHGGDWSAGLAPPSVKRPHAALQPCSPAALHTFKADPQRMIEMVKQRCDLVPASCWYVLGGAQPPCDGRGRENPWKLQNIKKLREYGERNTFLVRHK